MFPVARDRTSTAATNTRNKARLQEKGRGGERQDEWKSPQHTSADILQQNKDLRTIHLSNEIIDRLR